MAVPVTGTIAPYPDGTYASIDSLTGIDGWRSVADIATRNAITALRRRQGMIVVVQTDTGGGPNIPWQLTAPSPWAFDDSDWTQLFSLSIGLQFVASCRAATAAALTATYSNGTLGVGATLTNATTQAAIVIDGVTLALNDRVLVKNQAAPAQNGIYTATTLGDGSHNWVLTRATDYDEIAEILEGTYTVIAEGTANAETLWVETQPSPITVGTTAIVFTQLKITGLGTVTSVGTGTGLTGGPITTSGTISLAAGGVGTTEISNSSVTYVKLQDEAAFTLLGNPTGSSASPSEITLGAGLSFAGSTLVSTGGGGGSGVRDYSFLLYPGADAAVATFPPGLGNYVIVNRNATLVIWDIAVLVRPLGADLILDVYFSTDWGNTWTSLWASNTANRPKVVAGSVHATGTFFDTTAMAASTWLWPAVAQVGSSTPGSGITLSIGATVP